MISGDPMKGALLVAFNALIEVAAPDRVVPVLRHAVTTLLADGPTSTGTSGTLKKHRSPWTGDLATWAPLRDKIRTIIDARGLSHREFALELGIPHNALRPSLLPRGHAPSQANLLRLQRWLEAAETVTESRSNGHADQLTTVQREQLAGYRQLDEQTVRHQTGVTLEVIKKAVAGHSLAPEIVDRLVNFLAAPRSA